MQRVMIIGCCGAGKSTLARKLAEKTKLPLVHLDQLYWNANWKETPREIFAQRVAAAASKDEWIIDGNYTSTIDIRLAKTDTVIYLDYPTYKCFWRVIKRVVKYHGQVRPDMPKGCEERFDFEFLHYVATFNIVRRKHLLKKLQSLPEGIAVKVLKSDQAVVQYLSSLN